MPEPTLRPPISDETDHVQGPLSHSPGVVELVEYGDFQCPHCAKAAAVIQQLRTERGERLRFAFRHFPLTRLHPLARRAAEASEAAVAQSGGAVFWPLHDLLFARTPAITEPDLLAYAAELGLDADLMAADLAGGVHADRIQRDVSSAARSGVNGTPTFFINGRRHSGRYDHETLMAALDAAAQAGV